MATHESAEALRAEIGKALAFRESRLESRSEWGSITFEKAEQDFKRVFELLAHLSVLPMEYLTDSAVTQIQSETKQTSEVFARVDKFNIEQQTPTQTRDSLVTEIHGRADQLYTIASPWIPFLAYQKGDVAKNIEALTSSVGQAQTLIESAKVTIQARQSEIEGIITQAREASAAAGAAVFTQDFKNEAVSLDDQARKWLYLTASGAALTLLFAIIVWLFPIAGDDVPSIAQRFGGKLAALVVLFTATLWCGKTFKALKHLSTVNRHRALSLQTFQAFSHAASDDPTKDAVLMEATRAIFGSTPTGYLDAKGGSESDLKIIEIARTLGGKAGAA
ncbi:hypothetical protein PROAA_770006 [Candidatus Propionivibrio aalborgensis]|uniref:Uncharacterized protein n=1 Tax=Candidatus Propionivibrio aalborgensis TaxID=1860101 RepID=A0A1A8Y175_9RHOO|nr:hypothetical protein [Candidatus Propionivibrio aalborgensis]SBT10884.1 hypothetical protein PROAA_770006 [Candidatus Propionivibrio aalborgensis]